MDQLPHVTEEAAAMDKIMGDTPPDITQGTPVQEVSSKDREEFTCTSMSRATGVISSDEYRSSSATKKPKKRLPKL